MAWFRRKRDEAPETAGAAAGSVAPEPASSNEPTDGPPAITSGPAAPAAPAAAAPTAPAWTTAAPMPSALPTIQRVLDRVDARASTTLGRPAPLLLAPLGHAVTPDAPAGLMSALGATAAPDGPPSSPGAQAPLEYVQRAPAGSRPPRPAPPAQLLVPAFQPNRLPSLPVAPPEVQRAPAAPSLTTAPPTGPPMVLPVGDVIPAPDDTPHSPAEEPSAQAPLLTGAPAPAEPPAPAASVPAAELPLAQVQRHADHPGHVAGDEEPPAEVQRAAAAAAPRPPVADAPVLAEAAPLTATPLIPGGGAGTAGTTAPAADAPRAPDVVLPLAPVQRHADHPGHVDGDDEPAAAEVQRAVADAASPAPSAPLVGDAAPLVGTSTPALAGGPEAPVAPATSNAPDLPLPGAPVQRCGAPRRPVGLGRPLTGVPAGAVEPASGPAVPVQPRPSAPLLGATPPPPAPPLPLAAVQRVATGQESEDYDEPAGPAPSPAPCPAEAPPLDLVQRAPIDAPVPIPTAPLVGEAPLERTLSDVGTTPPAEPAGLPSPGLALVQRAPLATSGASGPAPAGARPGSTSSATTPASSSAPLPALVVAPLLGGRPFSTQVQRDAHGAGSAPVGLVDRSSPEALSPEPGRTYQPLAGIGVWNGAPPPDLPGPAIEAPPGQIAAAVQRATGTDVSNIRIRRDTGATIQRLSARAFTHDGEVHVPAAIGSLASGEGASLATHELVHAGQQSALGSARPHEHTPGGQALEAQARSAEHASLAGLDLPTLPLAPAATPPVQRALADGGGSSPFSPQQLSTLLGLASNPPGNGAAVQRLEVPPPTTPPPPPPSAEAVPQAPAAPAEHHQTPQELEELATKLFPTLRNLFRTELLGFRRRSGTSSDRPLS